LIEFMYSATDVGDGTWIVKRVHLDEKVDEALIYKNEAAHMTRDQVIQYAIKRGSWA
jgi:hypothetical protein